MHVTRESVNILNETGIGKLDFVIWGTGKRIGPNLKSVYTSSQKGNQRVC